MPENSGTSLCPRCGAVLSEETCTSCGCVCAAQSGGAPGVPEQLYGQPCDEVFRTGAEPESTDGEYGKPDGSNMYPNTPYENYYASSVNQDQQNAQYRDAFNPNTQYQNTHYQNVQHQNTQYGPYQYQNGQYQDPRYGNGQYPVNGNRPKQISGGTIALIVILGILGIVFIMFLIFLGAGFLYASTRNVVNAPSYNWTQPKSDPEPAPDSDDGWKQDPPEEDFPEGGDNPGEEGDGTGGYEPGIGQDVEGIEAGLYYELEEYIRKDLPYQVVIKEETFIPDEYTDVSVKVGYPVISGSTPGIDYFNEILEHEYTYFVDYFYQDFREYAEKEDAYLIEVIPYVTYMDEEVMSVVFEELVSTQYFEYINFYCVNFNMKEGVILYNTELLNIDKAFVRDFRERERKENGEKELIGYTDQDLLQMLSDEEYLVIFYTPMGMGVGLNLDTVVVYVTYREYEKYLNSF